MFPTVTLDHLKPFCSVDETRPYILKPFSDDKFTYATDGRILIRTPKIEAETPLTDDLQKVLNQCLGLFKEDASDGNYKELPVDDGTWGFHCDQCEGNKTVTEIRCACCGDITELGCTITCPECDGCGKRYHQFGVMLGPQILNAFYLRKLATLAGCKIANNKQGATDGNVESCVLSIEWDGGDGRLMPMKSANNLE